jgi:hypothetical protein
MSKEPVFSQITPWPAVTKTASPGHAATTSAPSMQSVVARLTALGFHVIDVSAPASGIPTCSGAKIVLTTSPGSGGLEDTERLREAIEQDLGVAAVSRGEGGPDRGVEISYIYDPVSGDAFIEVEYLCDAILPT